jgi:glycosyl transferase family 25
MRLWMLQKEHFMRFLQSLEKNYRRLRDEYRRRAQNKILKQRWARKSDRPPVAQANGPFGLERCEIHYINLKHREDRRAEIQSEFKALGVTRFARFEAIADANGALGCAKSHETVLSSASILEDQLLMICEDDCQFIADRAAIDAAIEEFFYNPHLDVLCLAYNAKNGFAISQNLMITSDTQTMSCYILKAAAIAEVLGCARFSVENLSRGGAGFDYAIDRVWKRAQRQMFFALTKDHFARQRPSFSDIEQNYQDYGL